MFEDRGALRGLPEGIAVKQVLASVAGALAFLVGSPAVAENPTAHLCDPAKEESCTCLTSPAACGGAGGGFPLCLQAQAGPSLLGWQLDLQSHGDVQIEGFTPSAPPGFDALVHRVETDLVAGTTNLRINWVYDGGEAWPGDTTSCVGRLALSAGGGKNKIVVMASSAAVQSVPGADLALLSIDAGSILLPEPSRAGLLVAGIALLYVLAGRSRRRGILGLVALLAVSGVAARADVVAASRALLDADFDVSTTPQLGAAMAATGDLDGDGVDDLILGLPDADSGRGRVLLVTLRRDGSVKGVSPIGHGEGGFPAVLTRGDQFGSAVASLGDLNGDRVPDLAVALPGSEEIWLLLMRRGGPTGSEPMVNVSRRIEISGPVHALAGLGDVNLDGVPDLAVGQPEFDRLRCGTGGACGSVRILYLRSDGTLQGQSVLSGVGGDVPSLVAGDRFGAALAPLGDLDGNGVRDLAVGMPGYLNGRGSVALVLLGIVTSTGSMVANGVITSRPSLEVVPVGGLRLDDTSQGFPGSLQSQGYFGSALANVGDWEGNGTEDLVVGAPGWGTRDEGAVFLLPLESPAGGGGVHGSGVRFDGSTGEVPEAFGENTAFGRSLSALRLDGDADLDILAGAIQDAAGINPGLVWQLLLVDSDGEGAPDALSDNCPDVVNSDQLDSDGDGVGDACDNCANTQNGPAAGLCIAGDSARLNSACTADADCNGSSGGGFCSTDQEDADLDGIGDVCEGVEVRLTGPYAADPSIAERHWKLGLDCGAQHVDELALALFQSDLRRSSDLHFAGCGEPPEFGGAACGAAGAAPGARVGGDSGAFMTDASGAYPAGGLSGLNPHTLYAFLEGSSTPGGHLCSAYEEDVPVGWFGDPDPAPVVENLTVAASQLELVNRGPGALLTGTGRLDRFCLHDWPAPSSGHVRSSVESFDDVSEDSGLQRSFKIPKKLASESISESSSKSAAIASAEPAAVKLFLNPAFPDAIDAVAEDDASTFQAWEVCFQASEPLNRFKLAIGPPLEWSDGSAAYFREQMKWAGCDDATEENACTKSYGEDSIFLYPVDATQSQVHLPIPTGASEGDCAEGSGCGNRIYPVLGGAKLGYNDHFVRLNTVTDGTPFQLVWHCLGQVRVYGGSAKQVQAPTVFKVDSYLGGLSPFCIDDPGSSGCEDVLNQFDYQSASADQYAISKYCGDPFDDDSDGVRLEADNCTYVHNPLQEDGGALMQGAPEGRDFKGNACQCGESDGDGIISEPGEGGWVGQDLQNLLAFLVGDPPDEFDEARCNLIDSPGESTACNILDAVKLKQALVAWEPGSSASLPDLCPAYDPPLSAF